MQNSNQWKSANTKLQYAKVKVVKKKISTHLHIASSTRGPVVVEWTTSSNCIIISAPKQNFEKSTFKITKCHSFTMKLRRGNFACFTFDNKISF